MGGERSDMDIIGHIENSRTCIMNKNNMEGEA